MNVKQAYFDFLEKQGAKQKIQQIIENGINEWKKAQAYYYEPNDNDPGDYSGHCHMNGHYTIGDIAKTDMEVLKAYTGDSEATYTSGCGLRWLRVADRISWNINDCLSTLRGEFINENADDLLREYDLEEAYAYGIDDLFVLVDEEMVLNDFGLDHDWMLQEFPEYEIDDEDFAGCEYIFNIRG